jgi:hypothetical protein
MPTSPRASKREVSVALAVSQRQAEANDEILRLLERVARDADISKAILCRPFWGRLTWLVCGR